VLVETGLFPRYRYGDIVDRLSFYAPYRSDPGRWAKVLEGFREAG